MPQQTIDKDPNDIQTIYTNDEGEIHRDGDEPAIVHTDGTNEWYSWYQHNKVHRDGDKPAIDFSKKPGDGSLMWYKEGKQHRDGGPSTIAVDGYKEYWLNDVQVTEEIACTPAEKLDPNLAVSTENVEVRREIVRKIGVEILLHKLGGKVLHKEGDYELLEIKVGPALKAKALKMLNPSVPEVYHVEFVAPHCQTVQEALNFRNGITPDQIDDENGADWYQQGDVILKPKDAKKLKSRPKDLT